MLNKIDLQKLPEQAPEYDLSQLLEAGCHFGHLVRRGHPKMLEWIYMAKDGVHIFDLAKTAQQLQHAYNYAYQLGKEKKVLVLVGTKRQVKETLKELGDKPGIMYITSRWLGGLLTNWEQVSKSLKRMLKIESGLEGGTYDNHTKYERVQLEKEAGKLDRFFGGLRELKGIPDALFVIDPEREKIAIKEANALGVPVMALADSNADPRTLDLVIPANDDAQRSVNLIIGEIVKAYQAGQQAK